MKMKKLLQATSIIATLIGAVCEAILVAYNAANELKLPPESSETESQ